MKHVRPALCCALLGLATLPVLAQAPQPSDDDKKFLATAAQSDQNEIALSKIAEKDSTTPEVKALAKKMIYEHTMMTATFKPYAQKWGVPPPSGPDADHQKEAEKLEGLAGKGKDFDKEYLGQMVYDHDKAMGVFTDEAKDTKLTGKFKADVLKGKDAVAAHKNMAYDLRKKL